MLLLLPHQLYELKHIKQVLDKDEEVILWEHPQYFKKYKYNKKRLILHRASMKCYFDKLKKNGIKAKYIEYNEKMKYETYKAFDPIDKIAFNGNIESPNFLLTKEDYGEYRAKTDKFLFNNFYMWSKKKLNILPKVKSKDKDNRKKLPKDIEIPELPSNGDKEYIDEAIRYVEKHFPKNYGDSDGFIYPVSHTGAKRFLKAFIEDKLSKFGDYQDAMSVRDDYLFHSVLSSSINIGLLNPIDCVDAVLQEKVPMNSLEGYIRQLFWREYQRYCYIYCDFSGNYFGNKKRLTKEWYTGKTGIDVVDDCIVKAFQNGYLHHIERLMIIGNYMNLSGIKPEEGFRWFMEFSCDSYEWVMMQNVMDMVFFVTGGITMRRPYVSSSNYILKMSDYKRGDWCDKWDKLYELFKKRNYKKLWKYRYYFGGLSGGFS